jgi:hypothetical protein
MLAPTLDRTAPISLASPPIDKNADLLGSKVSAEPATARTAAERLTIEGIAPSSPRGRADDFGETGGAASPPPVAAASPPAARASTTAVDSALPDRPKR